MLIQLAKYFNVSIDYLLGLTNQIQPELNKNQSKSEIGEILYDELIDIGFIKEGESFTKKHLATLIDILAPQVEFMRFKIKK